MKFAYVMLLAAVKAQEEEAAEEGADPCACVGADAVPADFFTEAGYPEDYGSECNVWDANEPYCAEGGDYAEEAYCAPDFAWCYVDPTCEDSAPTVFFADTEYADTLNWTESGCSAEGEEEGAYKMYAAASAALAVAALAM